MGTDDMANERKRRVAVCMPVFNAEPWLKNSVQSILGQTYEDFDLFLCDDGSTDGSFEIASSFEDPRVRPLKNDRNKGPAETRNRMNRNAIQQGYDYIAFMDADDVCRKDRLSTQIEILDRDPSLDICGASCRVALTGGRWRVSEEPSKVKVDCLFHNPIPTPTAVVRTSCLAQTKIEFAPNMVPCADYDFFSKLVIESNRPAIGVDQDLLTYNYNEAGVSHNDKRAGQIKVDKKIKLNISKILGLDVDSDIVSSFHDVAFRQEDVRYNDILNFLVFAVQVIVQNDRGGAFFETAYLRSRFRSCLSFYKSKFNILKLSQTRELEKTFVDSLGLSHGNAMTSALLAEEILVR
ncbi:glycosyltransferase family A protein [Ruegeria sp. THAF57]|uniref:glycosyltransferase family 2 protein n=1 Tax=Ruegeria sp. THAF57 TaxID=2744555 RepID=UPI001C609AD5|nr:glycosyltransferase family A protein [Ruegeria sp. THAF57]